MAAGLTAGLMEVNEVRIQALCVHNVLQNSGGGSADDAGNYSLRILSEVNDRVLDGRDAPQHTPGEQAAQSQAHIRDASGIYFSAIPLTVHDGLHIDKDDGVIVRVQLRKQMGIKGLNQLVGVVDIPLLTLAHHSEKIFTVDMFLISENRSVKCTFFTATSRSILTLLDL